MTAVTRPECLQNLTQDDINAIMTMKGKDRTPEQVKVYKTVKQLSWESRDKMSVNKIGPDNRPIDEIVAACYAKRAELKAAKAATKAATVADQPTTEATE